MKICLISEGAYPRITGGVSSWIQSIIMNMPEHEFIVFSISATSQNLGTIKYELPPNLLEIREIFLDTFIDGEPKTGLRYNITEKEHSAMLSLLNSQNADWQTLFTLFTSDRIDSIANFLGSKDFFDVVHDLCLHKFAHVPFTEMFWALRSMLLPLFSCIEQRMPEADLYHGVATGYAGVLGSLAKFQYDKPFLLTEHGIYTREREEEIIKADWIQGYFKDIWIDYFYNLSNCTYTYADKVTALFEKNRQIQIEFGCPAEKTAIIFNGIDTNRFDVQLRSKKPGIHIGTVARVVPIKDLKTMLQSFAIVNQHIDNVYFYIIGPTDENEEYYDECLEISELLELSNVYFTGEVNVLDYLKFLDILVLSSISEGQPLVILEALAMNIPIVATDVGACREMLTGPDDSFGISGEIVPVMDFSRLAEKIIKLVKNPELRSQYGSNGRNRVLALYEQRDMIRNYNQTYKKMRSSVWQA